MAHTDLLIFFNTAFWVFFLFILIYFLILVIFSSNTYFRVRIFSLHRIFLMTCLLSFFQLGLVLSKMLQYFLLFYKNLFIFKLNINIIVKKINNFSFFFVTEKLNFIKTRLINTFFSYLI